MSVGLVEQGPAYHGFKIYAHGEVDEDGKLVRPDWWAVGTGKLREPGNYWPTVFAGSRDGVWPRREDAERWVDAVLIPSIETRKLRKGEF